MMHGIVATLNFIYSVLPYTYNICAYVHIMYMSQVTKSVEGTMTSSTATNVGVDEKKSKKEQIIDEVIATETAYIKDLTDIIDVNNNNQ